MIPKLLEYEDGRVKVTAEAFAIPEIKRILDKHDLKAEPYLSFIYSMTSPDSVYMNIPEVERLEAVVYDIKETLGDFDFEDILVGAAIARLKKLYESPITQLADELAEELHRMRKLLRSEELRMGEDGNFKERVAFMKDISKIASEYTKVRDQADKEKEVATKGDHEIGDY